MHVHLAANEGISVPGGHMAGSVAIAAGSIAEAVAHVEEAKKELDRFLR